MPSKHYKYYFYYYDFTNTAKFAIQLNAALIAEGK